MIVLTFPVIKWGPELITSTVGHQFKCKPRTGLAKLDVGIYWFSQCCICETGTLSTPKGSSLKIKRRHFMLQPAKATASIWIGQCELGSETTDLHARSGGLAEPWWALTVLTWYLLTKAQSQCYCSQKAPRLLSSECCPCAISVATSCSKWPVPSFHWLLFWRGGFCSHECYLQSGITVQGGQGQAPGSI